MTAALAEKPATHAKTSSKATRKQTVAKPTPAPTTPDSDELKPATATPDADTSTQPSTPAVPDWDHAKIRERREALGVSRSALAELTGLSGSRIWASETPGKVLTEPHMREIAACLDRLERDGVPAEFKAKPRGFQNTAGPTKEELKTRLTAVMTLLSEARFAKTLAEKNALIEQAQAAGAPAPTTESADDDNTATSDAASTEEADVAANA